MSSATNYVEAVREVLSDDDKKHTLSVAMVTAATLSYAQPALFEVPIFPDMSDQANRALQVAVAALAALGSQGVLPTEDRAEGVFEVFKDPQLRTVLLGVALELLDTIDKDPSLVAPAVAEANLGEVA